MDRRILIVANQTAPGPHLKEMVRARLEEGPCKFTLLVPVMAPPSKWTWNEDDAFALAQRRMLDALVGLKDLGAEIEGHIEEGPPMDAIAALIQIEGFEHHQPFDEIILSTLAPGASRWLKRDLPHRLERRFGIPVTHVIGEPAEALVG